MEDGNALIITIKTESTVIEPFDVFEEHKYSKIMHDDLDYCSQLNHTIDIKEEDYNIETENSCLGEIEIEEDTQGATSCGLLVNKGDDDPLQCKRQIKTEKFDYDFEELEKDKFMKSENCGYSQTLVTEQNQSSTLITNQDQTQYFNLQKIKEEGFDYELAELHHSIDIKDENEKDNDDFSEMETTLQEFEFNSNIDNTSANSHYQTSNEHLKIDAPGRGRKYFEYKEEMEEIFGKKKNIHPELLLSTTTIDNLLIESPGHNENEGIQDLVEEKEDEEKVVTRKVTRKRVKKTTVMEKVLIQRKTYYDAKLEIEKQKLEEIQKRNKLLEERNKLIEERNEILKGKD